jgi:hypothetical protein
MAALFLLCSLGRAARSSAGAAHRNACSREGQMSEKVPIIVVFGLDIDGKPHASRFEDRDASFVLRAAQLMGFHVVHVSPENAELHAIAEGLPVGKIFASGRAFVPFVGRAAFDKLAALVEGGVNIEQRATSGAKPVHPLVAMLTSDAINTADALWAKIAIGTVVLAAQPDPYGPGWWQSVVVAVEGNDLTLRWVDDPAEKPFRLSRNDVGLRHPRAD